ncbi:response regulator [Halobacteriales archaeon QH_2_65_14]|nr:MAG: response regulator [Halobacteriales archaeon QH_2_65_14]
MSSPSESATVLVVDDEREVAEVYALRLRDEYETRIAYGGTEALDEIDEEVDVVLLDRRMPDISGDQVLDRLREQGYDCRVVMLTAVDPGLDIVDMQFDDYLCKPVEKHDLVDAIDQQLQSQQYDETLAEYLEVTSKLVLLEAEVAPQELENSDELDRLREKARDLKAELEGTIDELDDIETAFKEIKRHPG